MPFINRSELLKNTLRSFEELYADREDFEVILIEDIKNKESLDPIILSHNMLITRLESKVKDCYNPAPLFNEGARLAMGDILILTSPEILHAVDVLGGLDEELSSGSRKYVVCSCKNKGAPHTMRGQKRMVWYQHSAVRNKLYHFCSAIPKQLCDEIGGFDEEYGKGIAYDDDDFLRTVQEAGIEIVTRDDLETWHQWHDKITVKVPGYREKLLRNKHYYERKWEEAIAL